MKKLTADSLKKSQSLLRRAQQSEALIHARPELFYTGSSRIGGYPLFVERASGSYIWDVDGNSYLDFLLGYGSVILGHAHKCVTDSVIEVYQRCGSNPTLLSMEHIKLAERLTSTLPNIDRVTFFKTGSDATDAAARLARAYTGKPFLLRWGMNGWHDWCAPVKDGVLEESSRYTIDLDYGDLDQVNLLFETHRDQIAAVILMPYDNLCVGPKYLQGLRRICDEHNALLVLDEIRSGFRISMGGAQKFFDVKADLVTYGKALSNGHALSALGGRGEIMDHILRLGLTITYFRTPAAMAAAIATINVLEKENGPDRLNQLGQKLLTGLSGIIRETGIQAETNGYPSTPSIEFRYESPFLNDRALRMFCNGMLVRGILLPPNHHWFLCLAMTETDIDFFLENAGDVLREMISDLNTF